MDDELYRKYSEKLSQDFGRQTKPVVSSNYLDFKKANLPKHFGIYEKLCNTSEKILKLKPDPVTSARLTELTQLCHLNVTPAGVTSLAILAPLLIVLVGGLTTYLLFKATFFVMYFIILGLIMMVVLNKLPEFFANSWRMQASNQMVQCIFYVVTYMRHTSNLELAIDFASLHLSPPLSIDLRKVLWDLETEKYSTIKESLDIYLDTWRKWNMEFIEAFHLIEGSLFEPDEGRRMSMIDKSLEVMLEETYEKMLHYAHELRSPITMLYMLGIILPILGLVILPLVASFMTGPNLPPGRVALYMATLYNITLPLAIYYLGKTTMSKRPTGYGQNDISEENPELRKYRNILIQVGSKEIVINPIIISVIIAAVFLFIGFAPLLVQLVTPREVLLAERPILMGSFKIFDYRMPKYEGAGLIGPYGLGAALMSLAIPLGLGLAIGFYFKKRSVNVIKIRENAKQLEEEFASALFQLGNRLGDGIPAEIAFSKVSDVMTGTLSGEFFQLVVMNMRRLGWSIEKSIFDPQRGALVYFPSSVIESTMKVLVESSKKGPLIASQALINVSEYIKEIHRVNERLKDLMADLISDMKQQINILAPAISGIVVGITSMIVTILGSLSNQLANFGDGSGGMTSSSMLTMFGDAVPAYYFQIIVGLYLVEITFILTIMINGIENGADKLSERYNLGVNITKGVIIYTILAGAITLCLNLLAGMIMGAVFQPGA